MAASASAEFFADIMLAPMEATKVRVQTHPGAPPTLRGCAPMIYKAEGLSGFFKVRQSFRKEFRHDKFRAFLLFGDGKFLIP